MAPRLRTAFVGIFLVAYLLLVGPPALLLAWIFNSPALLFRLAVPSARFGLWGAGVRIRVSGRDRLDPRRNYLFMPNHCSNVDPPVVVAALRRDTRMMAKASLFRIPIFGAVMRFAGFVPVEREHRDAAIVAVHEATGRLRAGLDFVVFPEGTRSRDDKLLPLKKGPFFMAVEGGAPVVPVRVRGSRAVMPRGGKVIHPGEITVEVLEPIEVPAVGVDAEAAREELRHAVRAALEGGRDESPVGLAEGDLTPSQGRVTPEG